MPGFTPGQTVTLRVVTRGSVLDVYAGAKKLITVNDPGYPVGNIGLATGGAARFDNVRLNPGSDPAEAADVSPTSSYESDGWSAAA
ncbi:hypothetical protein ABZW10_13070 [Kitasatospora sp. NPDC004723]|uniref:hypothetical protein n=1 Tax=Kitasatospora sp. NPDC004723 TaxID=3154288 RepID=UPI0033A0AE54